MFDRAIIDTDRFMDMSMSSKALYFLLGMEADDEGFVSYKKVMRIHGGNDDDIKVLQAKNFIIKFDSGVVVITDWNANNYLDRSRIKATEYQTEKEQLALTDTRRYVFNNGLTLVEPEEYRVEEKSIEQKRSVGEFKNVHLGEEELSKLVDRYGRSATKHLIDELSAYLKSSGKRYKDHYATLLNWARRKSVVEVTRPTVKVEEEPLTPEQIARNAEMREKIKSVIKRI